MAEEKYNYGMIGLGTMGCNRHRNFINTIRILQALHL
jgi:hypothetical protein